VAGAIGLGGVALGWMFGLAGSDLGPLVEVLGALLLFTALAWGW
jgi:hypothetical protein